MIKLLNNNQHLNDNKIQQINMKHNNNKSFNQI